MIASKPRILVIDDEPLVKDLLYESLTQKKYRVEVAENGATALKKLSDSYFDLVITDLRIPDIDGLQILKAAKQLHSDLGVIVITAYGTIETAVEAMKVGAFDYLTKPFSLDELDVTLSKYFNYKKLIDENVYLKTELQKVHHFDYIIGKSEAMQKVFEIVKTVAESKATVLIYGASGTGKELIARAIHLNSPRRDRPFVTTNCAALPETLAESELFGHEKGAFTGAIKETKGRFESAHSGTLLMDEISEMSLFLQPKLLRVLQESAFEKVGCTDSVQVDVRIIVTTNKDLKEQVKLGKFREDLFYRLNVVPISLPPLKDRKDDIPLLAKHFLTKYSTENNKSIAGFADNLMTKLMNYDWPGNVRELEKAIERAVVISKESVLQNKDFPLLQQETVSSGFDIEVIPMMSIKDMEKMQILKALKFCKGNKTQAAKLLGISVRTLRNKLKEYNILESTLKV
jgi:DNA-binding NtrC family response regulator